METDITRALKRFKSVSEIYTEYFNYYDGDQPLRYSAERLNQTFDAINVKFRQNWCAVVVNSVLDRLELYGWSTPDETITAALSDAWSRSGLSLESNEIHESALVTGESFLIGWKNEDTGEIEFYYNDPRRAAVFYDEDHPRRKTYAAKWWDAEDGAHIMLYYPDRLEEWAARKPMKEVNLTDAAPFHLIEDSPNPYGTIPVFHFRNSQRRTKSELKNVTEPQDAINKLLCDMMVTAEFAAFPARYVISGADISELKNSPNQIWDLPGGIEGQQGTQVGTLAAADLSNYADQIDRLASSIAIITSTPKHYFVNSSAAISGEALITMEAPLIKKVLNRRELFGATWAEVGQFMALLLGYQIDRADIQPQWGKAESEQPLTEVQILKEYIAAGLPMQTALRLQGYTAAEIDLINQEAADAAANQASLGALLLEQARARDSQTDTEA